MINYKCPKCSIIQGVLITPTAPVVCTGVKKDPITGEFRKTHSPTVCVIVTDDGEIHQQPKQLTKEKAMSSKKEAANLCGCYSVVDGSGVHTSCGRLVKGKFAPGHDAKLKGMLIRAAAAGEQFKTKDGTKVTNRDPLAFAKELGWGALIEKGIAVAKAKANRPKRNPRPAGAKPAKKAAASSKNRVAPKGTVSRDELKARAAKKAAAKNASKEASLV